MTGDRISVFCSQYCYVYIVTIQISVNYTYFPEDKWQMCDTNYV